jgi:phage I-like protein
VYLQAFLKDAPVIAAGLQTGQSASAGTQATAGGASTGALDAAQIKLCSALGITPEAFAKQQAATAA